MPACDAKNPLVTRARLNLQDELTKYKKRLPSSLLILKHSKTKLLKLPPPRKMSENICVICIVKVKRLCTSKISLSSVGGRSVGVTSDTETILGEKTHSQNRGN
jgi:hypothetical protein